MKLCVGPRLFHAIIIARDELPSHCLAAHYFSRGASETSSVRRSIIVAAIAARARSGFSIMSRPLPLFASIAVLLGVGVYVAAAQSAASGSRSGCPPKFPRLVRHGNNSKCVVARPTAAQAARMRHPPPARTPVALDLREEG